jgi:hypothetical protein
VVLLFNAVSKVGGQHSCACLCVALFSELAHALSLGFSVSSLHCLRFSLPLAHTHTHSLSLSLSLPQAQKTAQEGGAGGGPGGSGRPVKLSKASFLSQLKAAESKAAAAAGGGGGGGQAAGGGVLGLKGEGAPGWRVLQDDFSGLPGEHPADTHLGRINRANTCLCLFLPWFQLASLPPGAGL